MTRETARALALTGAAILLLGSCDGKTGLPADAGGIDGVVLQEASAGDSTPVDGAPADGAAPTDLAGEQASMPDAGGPDAAAACIKTLIPSQCQSGYDAQLEALATAYERSFHTVSTAAWGVWADLTVSSAANRQIIDSFIKQGSGWDFKGSTGKDVTSVVTSWNKTAGLYAGVGIAADAFRYGVLRDQGYPGAEVDQARKHLLAGLDGLHLARMITGTPGAIARGFIRTDKPTYVYPTTPLFDSGGNPLPAEKNNGTWRADNSTGGQYPSYIWEDSCSRDQLIGWVAAMGAAWEVIENDSSIPQSYKQNLQADAKDLGLGLKKVRPSGYDLELIDADGRTTYHGYLHENAFDRIYIPNPWVKNGVNAVMALGIIATLVHVSGDQALTDYLNQQLIAKRKLHVVIKDQLVVDMGPKTNYSGYNMAYMGAWLAVRYLKDAQALTDVRKGLEDKLYDSSIGATKPQPKGWKQSLFDVIYAAGMARATAHGPTTGTVDATALSNALDTLKQFPDPPFWDKKVVNCDAQELQNLLCTAVDGKTTFVINPVSDRGDHPQSLTPVPFKLRPPSNYDWRSNPFRVNGDGNEANMLTGVDFRIAYWMGRWVRR